MPNPYTSPFYALFAAAKNTVNKKTLSARPSSLSATSEAAMSFGVSRSRAMALITVLVSTLQTFSVTLPGIQPVAFAKSWQTALPEHDVAPPRMVAVDKAHQQVYLLEGEKKLAPVRIFSCTTGQAIGDKYLSGDLKTPEGIYFVTNKIGLRLDYAKYGPEAYGLNYPNPVDKLRRKTGHGIWLHGRGEGIAPLLTEGCIAMNNDEIIYLGTLLAPGTPVALTTIFSNDPEKSKKITANAQALKQLTQDWSDAWAARSAAMFGFYNKNAYSIAQGQPFSAFQSQKERLFKSLEWITSDIRDIQVLEGTDYWVSWFYQDYRAPNLSTSGVRRLYWEKDSAGAFKIVGMEWLPGLDTRAQLKNPVPAPKQAVVLRDATTSGAVPVAISATPMTTLKLAIAKGIPTEPAGGSPAIQVADAGQTAVQVAAVATDASVQPATAAGSPQAIAGLPRLPALTPEHRENSAEGALEVPSPKAIQLAKKLAAMRVAQQENYQADLQPEKASPQGQPRVAQVKTPAKSRDDEGKISPTVAMAQPVARTPEQPPVQPRDNGTQTPVQAPEPVATQQNGAAEQAAVKRQIESWRTAWESGNIPSYIAFYAKDAKQERRSSAQSIRTHKERIWPRVAPAKVALTNVKVAIDGTTARVAMTQEYTDSQGKRDRGIKNVIMKYRDNKWLITEEHWSAFPNEASN